MEPSTQIETPGIPQLIQAAIREHEQFEAHLKSTWQHGIACGEFLLELRKRIPDGEWTEWQCAHIPFPQMTTWRYMRAAETWRKLSSNNMLNDDYLHDITLSAILNEDKCNRQTQKRSQEEQALLMLHAGHLQSEVAGSLKMDTKRVAKLYKSHVLPKILARDWVAEVAASRIQCKPMVVARLKDVIIAHRGKSAGGTKDWRHYASHMMPGMTISFINCADFVLSHGCAQLIQRCDDGTIALSTAYVIAQNRNHDAQRKLLMQEKIRQQSTVLDDAKQMAIRMLDQVLNWRQLHPGGVRELAEVEPDNEVDCKEVIANLEHIAEFCLDVASSLTAGDGNVYARQQNGKLPQPDGSKV